MKKLVYIIILVLLVASASAFEWLDADSHDFEIIPVTNDNGAHTDYISNGESWFSCNKDSINKGIEPPAGVEFGSVYHAKSAKFLCVQQNDDYVFLECCTNSASDERKCELDNPLSQQIAPGGASTILLRNHEETFTRSDALVLSAGNDFYITDWRGYSYLNVHFTISGQPLMTVHLLDKNSNVAFSAKLTDYVVNTPLLGKPMYAQIPLPSLTAVEKIVFRYTSAAVPGVAESTQFDLHQAYLVSSTNPVSFCSGAKYLEGSVESPWLADLDFSNPDGQLPSAEPAGKSACNAIPGFAWTGTQCCGDDTSLFSSAEYYRDTEAGCWNGNNVGDARTAMDVVISVDYKFVQPLCGNSIMEKDEVCDSNTRACTTTGGEQGTQACNTQCLEYDTCVPTIQTVRIEAEAYSSQSSYTSLSSPYASGGVLMQIAYLSSAGTLQYLFSGQSGIYDLYVGSFDENDGISKLEYYLNGAFVSTVLFADNLGSSDPSSTNSVRKLVGTRQVNTGDTIKLIGYLLYNTKGERAPVDYIEFVPVTTSNPLRSVPTDTRSDYNLTYFCPHDTCTYPAPPGFPYNINTLFSSAYDLYFISQSSRNSVLINTSGFIVREEGTIEAHNVDQQILFDQNNFYTCNADNAIPVPTASLQCNIKQSCGSSDAELLGISDLTNAHAELPTQHNYPLRLCCGGIGGVSNQDSGNYKSLLSLSDATNAHAEKPAVGTYSNPVSISVPQSVPLDCRFAQISPGLGYTCLFSISGETNAHIGRCGAYAENLYCKAVISTPPLALSTQSTCSVLGNYFCSPERGWSNALSSYPGLVLQPEERNTNSDSLALSINSASCCSSTSCWNGTVCVADQSAIADPNNLRAEIYGGARCVAGEWVVTRKVFTWDKKESGYCPRPDQCLVDFEGDPELNDQPFAYYEGNTPMCITHGQFVLDNYCTSGNWTTRTKLVALELLDYVKKIRPLNYTLFCDEPAHALVDIGYSTVLDYVDGPSALAGIGSNALRTCFEGSTSRLPCVNNLCVLNYVTQAGDTKKAFGISLNKQVDDAASSFLNALHLDEHYCDAEQGIGRYKRCSSDDNIWFNRTLNSIIYSKDGINLEPASTFETIGNWFGSLYYGLINWLLGRSASLNPDADYSFTTNTSRFNKLYIDSRPGHAIYGFQEEIGENVFMLINYTGFRTDICRFVNNRLSIPLLSGGQTPVGVVCEADAAAPETVIYTDDVVAAALWQDFTSKLRVS